MRIRTETDDDIKAISCVVTEALRLLAQSTGTEARIVERLRAEGGMILSLVAEENGVILGSLVASPARIGRQEGWGLIGPLAVLPSHHRQGIGHLEKPWP